MPTGGVGVRGLQGLQGPTGDRGPTGIAGWANQPYINVNRNNPTGPTGSFGGINQASWGFVYYNTNYGYLNFQSSAGNTTIPNSGNGYGGFYYNTSGFGIGFNISGGGGFTLGTNVVTLVCEFPTASLGNSSLTKTKYITFP
jgi:hypothetical protein